ncbi:MAG: hypothetical protein BWX98_01294 [Candidatus Aminicenantes bacterium ADurb.Bin147]|nr:MAG: hypothetical protein BWX98_01294 [Candidatus Aminicenantes bacterium ADurb.Bin147]
MSMNSFGKSVLVLSLLMILSVSACRKAESPAPPVAESAKSEVSNG